MIRALATITTTLAALGGCGATDPTPDVASSTVPPTRPAQTITIGEYYTGTFVAESGDYLILVMEPEGDVVGRCIDIHHGEPIWNPYTLIWACEGVDF